MLLGELLLNAYLIVQLSQATVTDFTAVQGSDYLQVCAQLAWCCCDVANSSEWASTHLALAQIELDICQARSSHISCHECRLLVLTTPGFATYVADITAASTAHFRDGDGATFAYPVLSWNS